MLWKHYISVHVVLRGPKMFTDNVNLDEQLVSIVWADDAILTGWPYLCISLFLSPPLIVALVTWHVELKILYSTMRFLTVKDFLRHSIWRVCNKSPDLSDVSLKIFIMHTFFFKKRKKGRKTCPMWSFFFQFGNSIPSLFPSPAFFCLFPRSFFEFL